MTKEEAFREINKTQDEYVDQLIDLINKSHDYKTITFQSPTGSGKTKMMAKLMNKLSDKFFLVTTLSKGQLDKQVKRSFERDCKYNNYIIYGASKLTAKSKLTRQELLSLLPDNKEIIWLRDEGHIRTNNWHAAVEARCNHIIDISATPAKDYGIKCNFNHTMMLRAVSQNIGTPEDALDKLLEIKEQHKNVPDYNPCAIMRILDDHMVPDVMRACDERGLTYINITTEDYDMSELCEDDSDCDVIFNKFKMTEGIDIRRAHVLYMDNEPGNVDTTIQVIGRCRRNALLYRDDLDILDPSNEQLLKDTRRCYVYYNVASMNVDTDEDGELYRQYCDTISCQDLKANITVHVDKGELDNGLHVLELEGKTGDYHITVDPNTGFNVVDNPDFYRKSVTSVDIYDPDQLIAVHARYKTNKVVKVPLGEILHCWKKEPHRGFNYALGRDARTGNYVYRNNYRDTTQLQINLPKNKVNRYLDTLPQELEYPLYDKDLTNYYKAKQDNTGKLHYVVKAWYFINDTYLADTEKDIKYGNRVVFISNCLWDNIRANIEAGKLTPIIKACINIQRPKINYHYSNRKADTISFDTEEQAIGYLLAARTTIVKKLVVGFNRNKDLPIIIKSNNNHYYIPKAGWKVIEDIQPADCPELLEISDDKLAEKPQYLPYKQVENDRELAIVGTDLMTKYKNDDNTYTWGEVKSITAKLKGSCKFNFFISDRNADIIDKARPYFFTDNRRDFGFDSKCNACLGYCVEYYSKYLFYGEDYLKYYIEMAKKESKVDFVNDGILVRACILKYRDNMIMTYGRAVEKRIASISVAKLVEQFYAPFVQRVKELGERTYEFIKTQLTAPKQGELLHSPKLATDHIRGLCDYLDKNTIIDIKCTKGINVDHIKQVLAYHYLSTKRDDLDIKQVIVYNAPADKYIKIDLTTRTVTSGTGSSVK